VNITGSELELIGGYAAGPLFSEYGKRRSPVLRTSRTHGARRRARERRATPAWLTDEQKAEIRRLYRLCEWWNELAREVVYVVDHVVPLDGKLVCGLHVPWNLRITTKLENAKKAWHTWPDMPMEQLELI
jgi:hypothetical protein